MKFCELNSTKDDICAFNNNACFEFGVRKELNARLSSSVISVSLLRLKIIHIHYVTD